MIIPINQENNTPKNQISFFTKNKKTLIGIGLLVAVIISVLAVLFQNENIRIHNSNYIFGIDVSHYQGTINWDNVAKSKHPIEFVFVRATMGSNGIDSQFKRNWDKLTNQNYIKGAYHYYRPNENSTLQFNNFKARVVLKSGDFPPVLDIEQTSHYGNENLRRGVLNWLALAEKHYGVKPIIYTGRKFYEYHLEGYVDEYPLWIASYSGKHRLKNIDWTFHQFTEKASVKGIHGKVDGNDFFGNYNELLNLCLVE